MNIQETAKGWQVESESQPGKSYEVISQTKLDEMGSMYFALTCTCSGWKYRRDCKHIDAVVQQQKAMEVLERVEL